MPLVLAIHCGCGISINRDNLDTKREEETRIVIQESLEVGYKVLNEGGSAIDAVVESVVMLEDCPLFNAGRGSVRTRNKTVEMDAGIMDGFVANAGGCSAVTNVKNPVLLAREVMSNTEHILLCGDGAEQFARARKLEQMPADYFETKLRGKQLDNFASRKQCNWFLKPPGGSEDSCLPIAPEMENGIGTVGAVALDSQGHFASCSSTGGMTGKMCGAVSHSSVPGAGFYATEHGAVSATGQSDALLLSSASARVIHLYEDKGLSMTQSLSEVLSDLSDVHAGFIAIDEEGHVHMPFNTGMMFRGNLIQGESTKIAIFKDEPTI